MKRVAVCAGDRVLDGTVEPGTTAADLLSQVGLSTEYVLSKRDGLRFGDTETVFGLLSDGDKVVASSKSDVGLRFEEIEPWGC